MKSQAGANAADDTSATVPTWCSVAHRGNRSRLGACVTRLRPNGTFERARVRIKDRHGAGVEGHQELAISPRASPAAQCRRTPRRTPQDRAPQVVTGGSAILLIRTQIPRSFPSLANPAQLLRRSDLPISRIDTYGCPLADPASCRRERTTPQGSAAPLTRSSNRSVA